MIVEYYHKLNIYTESLNTKDHPLNLIGISPHENQDVIFSICKYIYSYINDVRFTVIN